jgi:hypothetical protein
MKNGWFDLKTEPPTGKEYAVILFPCKTDCGVLYTIRNRFYAKSKYALKAGYTHWCNFELSQDHDKLVAWQDNLN